MSEEISNLNLHAIGSIDKDALTAETDPGHGPRILLLYGSLRQRSYRASWPKSQPRFWNI